MRLKTFVGFVAPSVVAMLLLIAVPLVGVVYLSLHSSHIATEMKEVTTEVPLFAGKTRQVSRMVPQAKVDEHGRPVRIWEYTGGTEIARAAQVSDLEKTLTLDRGSASLPEIVGEMHSEIMNYDFWSALEFTLIYVFVTTPFVLVIGFLLALAINRATEPFRGSLIFATLLPMIITPVVSALSIYWLFLDNAVVSSLLQQLGFGKLYFLQSSFTIRTIIIAFGIWQAVPFAFILLYAGLKTVPMDAVEAAMVDGANRWQIVRAVTVPHLAPLFVVIILIHMMDAYRVFEPILVFSSSVFANSLQYLTYSVLAFQDNIHKAASYAVLTVVGVVILLLPVLRRTWREQKGLR
jgi:multiple sugar transport system permease protein